jgi:hypothetical protein
MHAIEPLSPELALVDPDLRRRALEYPAPVVARPAASPGPAPPRRPMPVPAVALYATIRLLEVLMIGTVAALFLALSIALMVALTP